MSRRNIIGRILLFIWGMFLGALIIALLLAMSFYAYFHFSQGPGLGQARSWGRNILRYTGDKLSPKNNFMETP